MALQTSFEPVRREVLLAQSALDRFVGTFDTRSAGVITITRENDSLWAVSRGCVITMFAEGQQRFFLKAVDAQIVFMVDSTGSVTGLTLTYGGVEFTAPRVR